MADLDAELAAGYGFDDAAVILGRPLDPDLQGTRNEHYVQVPLRSLTKHGLIAGATGTGKTKTLQLVAEQLSRAGVPVFLADLKGDLTGLAEPSPGAGFIDERMSGMDLPWTPESFPVELLSITGNRGTPLRVPVSSFGPLLLAKVMDCTEVQESVLQVIFRYADEAGLALLDLEDLVALLKHLTSEEGEEVQAEYGGMSSQTLNVLLRKAMELETQGAEQFFGEPEFDVADLKRTRDGKGVVSVMNLTDVQTQPRIFSTFMMWLLAEVYETSPEQGDVDKPDLVFFFDEAHLLFEGASKALLESVELTVRMIRSKGVGVFFVTQAPTDLPDDVLGQLGNRVQHALRAFTPQDQKAMKATAQTFPVSEHYDVLGALTGLGVGEALVTVLGPKGAPTPSTPTRLMAPVSLMDPVDDATVARLVGESELASKYAVELDRESAAELLAARAEARAKAASEVEAAEAERKAIERHHDEAERSAGRRTTTSRSRSRETATEKALKSAASSIGREVGRQLIRGILGNLKR
ncbi:MAG: helicase HerA-like domain-containing protein [Actinomycetes bacterium]